MMAAQNFIRTVGKTDYINTNLMLPKNECNKLLTLQGNFFRSFVYLHYITLNGIQYQG